MEETITMSELNDFIFCPVSIYFHGLYANLNTMLYHTEYQIKGKQAHSTITESNYSTSKNILQNTDIYTSKYNIVGKLDLYDIDKGIIIERKNKINKIYDGHIYQVYAQYFGLTELGYKVNTIKIHSLSDNKVYNIALPSDNEEFFNKFLNVLEDIRTFNTEEFIPENKSKCEKCIYSNLCDRSLV